MSGFAVSASHCYFSQLSQADQRPHIARQGVYSYNTVQYSTVQYSTVQYSTVQTWDVQYSESQLRAAAGNGLSYQTVRGGGVAFVLQSN